MSIPEDRTIFDECCLQAAPCERCRANGAKPMGKFVNIPDSTRRVVMIKPHSMGISELSCMREIYRKSNNVSMKEMLKIVDNLQKYGRIQKGVNK